MHYQQNEEKKTNFGVPLFGRHKKDIFKETFFEQTNHINTIYRY